MLVIPSSIIYSMCSYAIASKYPAAPSASKIPFEAAQSIKLYDQCGTTLQASVSVV